MDLEILRKHRKEILDIAKLCNVDTLKVFGSVVRYESHAQSDVDFLVHMKPGSGFCIGGLKWQLEDLLQCKVDIIPDTALSSVIKNDVLKEAVFL